MDKNIEASIAGYQSMINGWVIEIQNIQKLIEEMEKKIKDVNDRIENIKLEYNNSNN